MVPGAPWRRSSGALVRAALDDDAVAVALDDRVPRDEGGRASEELAQHPGPFDGPRGVAELGTEGAGPDRERVQAEGRGALCADRPVLHQQDVVDTTQLLAVGGDHFDADELTQSHVAIPGCARRSRRASSAPGGDCRAA